MAKEHSALHSYEEGSSGFRVNCLESLQATENNM